MMKIRDMYEAYLTSQLQAVRIPVEGDRHCWLAKEERVETRRTCDWLGKDLGTHTIVIVYDRYVWLGSKGSIVITSDPKFSRKSTVHSKILLSMKRWVWNEYFSINL